MKKINKKGFTLIELLAVIIILGVLMIIAIPSVTTYIQNSRKSAYVDTAANYVDSVTTLTNEAAKIKMYSTETLYLIPVGDKMNGGVGENAGSSCVSIETGGQSPFSDVWTYAYVGVTYDGKGYNYYFISQDGAGQGLDFMTADMLKKEGTDKLYSNTNDAAQAATLRNMLKDAYSKKDNRVLTAGSGSTNIASTDLENLNKVIKTVDNNDKTTVVIVGTCAYTAG